MGEFQEFAEALFGQLSVEINEEKEIAELAIKAKEGLAGKVQFKELEDISKEIFPIFKDKVEEYLGVKVPDNLQLEFPELEDLKKLKGDKVFADKEAKEYVTELFNAVAKEDSKKIAELMKQDTTKYLVYSTYAIQYISKITTTYGDYLESVIYLNKFILSKYPQIILYKQGEPYESRFENVNSGYRGAVKMTVLEELIHSAQGNLQQVNKDAAMQVNKINEELASIILSLDTDTVNKLSEYCQLQAVPDNFPFAKKANLFFFLNPDHFLIEQIGPDVMTFTHVEIDPKIGELIPQLLDIYKRWLVPIQQHHAAFTAMEGMASFAIENILKDDEDFQNYLTTFMGTDFSSYQIRKSMGKDFTKIVYEKLGKDTFKKMIEIPPNTRELKEPQLYLKKMSL
jgi:rRNA maturation protein Rpf1